MSNARHYMQQALLQAYRGVGRTSPNPPVGAVLVQGETIIGRGFHPEAGQPHAEIYALREAGDSARGSTLYVTLEPCSHQGRTGPCAEALIKAGVKKVYVGTVDPNPQVSGQGVALLQQAGIEVVCGVLERQCKRLIAPFAKHVTTGLPFVIFKSAMTLDGQTATSAGESQWISSEQSRAMVHRLRDQVDGIMVGSGTVQTDNPRLTTRLPDGGRDPLRIVVDGRLKTSPDALVYKQTSEARTVLVTSRANPEARFDRYRQNTVEVLPVSEKNGLLDLSEALRELGRMNVQSILLEGGHRLAGAMLRAGLVDRVMIFIAPLLLGGEDGALLFGGAGVTRLQKAFRLTDLRTTNVGADILVEGEVAGCSLD